MFYRNLRFSGQIWHRQWPIQTSKMGQQMDFVLNRSILIFFNILELHFFKKYSDIIEGKCIPTNKITEMLTLST
jgi:hypothetical protein